MQILLDSCLALLASIGLWTLGTMLIKFFFRHFDDSDNTITIRICGDCTDFCKILRNDIDMFDELHAFDICRCESRTKRVHTEHLDGILCVKLKEAEKWTKKEITIK